MRPDAWACIFGALLLLIVPLDWLLAAGAAAAVHEICHLTAIRLLGGQVDQIRIHLWGAQIDTRIPGKRRELLCAAAGPAGSLFMLHVCHFLPKLALCAGIQGLYNLLPIYPMDGGRILECALFLLKIPNRQKILHAAALLTCIGLIILAAVCSCRYSLGYFPYLIALIFLTRVIRRKIPCKRKPNRVQ